MQKIKIMRLKILCICITNLGQRQNFQKKIKILLKKLDKTDKMCYNTIKVKEKEVWKYLFNFRIDSLENE